MDGQHEYEDEMCCIAEFSLDEGILEGAVLGIAKQIVGKGWLSLTSRQQEVFIQIAVPAAVRNCQRCGTEIIASELELGGTYCGWCLHQVDKGN